MADVRPFRGLRYNLQKTGDLSSVITPPYDVISEAQQHTFYEKNSCNLIRLELGKKFPDDTDQDNRYTRSAATLEEWIRDDVLVREGRPAYYLMEHRFLHQGNEKSYWALLVTVRLEEFDAGMIRATEITMGGPVEDRLNLLRACSVNLSPTMGAFIQKEGNLLTLLPDIDPAKPDMSATDDSGVTYNLWVVNDEIKVKELIEFFADKLIYIADGHHRYTTALSYQKEQQGLDFKSEDSRNFVMMALISSNDDGLIMLPTHRLVRGLKQEQLMGLKESLAEFFEIRELESSSSNAYANLHQWMEALTEAGKSGTVFGIYGLEAGKYLLLTPHNLSALLHMLPMEHPLEWRKLDVSLLHGIVLQGILGMDTPEKQKEYLEYSPDNEMVFQQVETGAAQLAIFLNPAPISNVMAVADANDRMPQKSTYFYPKTTAGMVMNPLFP